VRRMIYSLLFLESSIFRENHSMLYATKVE
jgi:hypothetical protein